jgi:hypothetical protein
MDRKVRTMLEYLFHAFIDKYRDPLDSWDRFIEFIAIDHCPPLLGELGYGFKWLNDNREFLEKVMTIYDAGLLKSDYHDNLGDIYHENIITKGLTQTSDIQLISEEQAKSLINNNQLKTGIANTILDPVARTGRLLMAIHKEYLKKLLFGVESDIRLYRIAYTNFLIHNIPGYLLHADRAKHEINLATSEGKYNWQFYNRWHSCMYKLLPSIKKIPKKYQ